MHGGPWLTLPQPHQQQLLGPSPFAALGATRGTDHPGLLPAAPSPMSSELGSPGGAKPPLLPVKQGLLFQLRIKLLSINKQTANPPGGQAGTILFL